MEKDMLEMWKINKLLLNLDLGSLLLMIFIGIQLTFKTYIEDMKYEKEKKKNEKEI